MKRATIYNLDGQGNETFAGWFDLDASTEIDSYQEGSPYITGKTLIATASGKLIINEWSNSGMDLYRFASDEREIAQILSEANFDDYSCNKKLEEELNKIMAEYEF